MKQIHHHRLAVIAATVILAPVLSARAAYNPAAFDPFGDRNPFPCDVDVAGTDAANRLEGGTKPDEPRGTRGLGVLGLGGNDTLIGKANVQYGDCLRGGAGNDRLVGGPGRTDTLKGDDGDDRITGGGGGDIIGGGDGADVLIGGRGNDVIDGEAGPDTIHGGPGDDWITGGAERNHIDAGPGADKVSSANGIAEVVRCGSGRDEVWADRADRLIGCERVRRIAPLYPVMGRRAGSSNSVFHARYWVPFSDETGAGIAGYSFDVPVHPKRPGCWRMTLTSDSSDQPGQRAVVSIRSTRKAGFCHGLYRGTITFGSSDTSDNCQTLREARAGNGKLDECDLRVLLGRFTFRVR